jgi:hypothetical protein
MSSVRGIWEGFGRESGLEGRRIRLGELEVDLVLPGEAFGKNSRAPAFAPLARLRNRISRSGTIELAQGEAGIERLEHLFYS